MSRWIASSGPRNKAVIVDIGVTPKRKPMFTQPIRDSYAGMAIAFLVVAFWMACAGTSGGVLTVVMEAALVLSILSETYAKD